MVERKVSVYNTLILIISRFSAGTRYYEIETHLKTLGARVSSNAIDAPQVVEVKTVHRRYTDFETLYDELVD